MIKRTYVMTIFTKDTKVIPGTSSATLSKRSFFEDQDSIYIKLKNLLMGVNRLREEDIEEVVFRRVL